MHTALRQAPKLNCHLSIFSRRNAPHQLKKENKVVQTHPTPVSTGLQSSDFIVAQAVPS